jgi:hypothetical protein
MASFETTFEEGMKAYSEAPDKAEAAVINMGLSVSVRPTNRTGEFVDFPQMPPDLSVSAFAELQRLIGQFTAWYGYAICQQKLYEGQRNSAEKMRVFAWSRIRKTKAGTVADKDDETRLDRRYVDADCRFEEYDSTYRLLTGIVEGLKRDIETISRTFEGLKSRQNAEGKSVGVMRRGQGGESHRETTSTVLDKFRKGRMK